MPRILITGGAGFIGANLVRLLTSGNADITVLDNLSQGRAEYLPDSVVLLREDVKSHGALEEAMRDTETVIHLAAMGSVVDSVNDPLPNFRANAEGTLIALEAARRAGVKRFIFASTGGALIGQAMPPVDELSLPKPISPYGASKLCGEAYCHAYAKSLGLNTTVLRFANVYGPYSGHKKGAVTTFIRCMMKNEPIPIYGSGNTTRDYLHVADLCDGIVKAMSADLMGGEVFHLASGMETSVIELAKNIATIAGSPDYPIEFLPERPGEVDRNFASYDKARRVLGFEPGICLVDGLKQTWRWYCEAGRAD